MTILFSFPDPASGKNPYTSLLASHLAEFSEVKFFSWRSALLTRYEIFHVHWPEQLFVGKSRAQTLVKVMAGCLLMLRLRLKRIPIVWTVHNVSPHENMHPVVSWAIRLLERQVQHLLILNASTAASIEHLGIGYSMIPHGHYLPTVESANDENLPPTDFLLFGLLRPYKNAPRLMSVFGSLAGDELSLTIAGKPQPPDYATVLADMASTDSRIVLELGFQSDSRLVGLIRSTFVVVLPYSEFNNSGAALLALSAGRPILIPASEASLELQEEFGDLWVRLFDGELDRSDLEDALHASKRRPDDRRPDLSSRDWRGIARAHHATYIAVRRGKAVESRSD